MDIVLKGFLQGSIPVVVFVGGAHHLTKKFKASKPVLYYGSLLAGLGLAYAVVEGKIKAPFMNAEEDIWDDEIFSTCLGCGKREYDYYIFYPDIPGADEGYCMECYDGGDAYINERTMTEEEILETYNFSDAKKEKIRNKITSRERDSMNAEEMFVDCYYCGRNIDLYDETNDSISCDECGKVACGSYKCNYSKNPKETWEDFTCGECVKGMNAETFEAEHKIIKEESEKILIQMTDDEATIDNAEEIIDDLVDKHRRDYESDEEEKELFIYFQDEEGKTLRSLNYVVRGNKVNDAIIDWFSDYDYPIGGYTAETFEADPEYDGMNYHGDLPYDVMKDAYKQARKDEEQRKEDESRREEMRKNGGWYFLDGDWEDGYESAAYADQFGNVIEVNWYFDISEFHDNKVGYNDDWDGTLKYKFNFSLTDPKGYVYWENFRTNEILAKAPFTHMEKKPLQSKERRIPMNAETFDEYSSLFEIKIPADSYDVGPDAQLRKWIRSMKQKGYSHILRRQYYTIDYDEEGNKSFSNTPEYLIYDITDEHEITYYMERDLGRDNELMIYGSEKMERVFINYEGNQYGWYVKPARNPIAEYIPVMDYEAFEKTFD